MDDLEHWLDETFRWIGSPEPNDNDMQRLRGEDTEPKPTFSAPTQADWPAQLLERLPGFLTEFFAEPRDIKLTARRVDQVVENLAIWIQQFLKASNQDRSTSADMREAISAALLNDWAKLYRTIQPFHAFSCEEAILRSILTFPLPQAITTWRNLIVKFPPTRYNATAASVETLIQRRDWGSTDLFPELLAALEHPTAIASILDLANWTKRHDETMDHPAANQADRLLSLLEAVVQRLEKFESDPTSFGTDVRVIQRVLDESVALCIALCDTLGLIQYEKAKEVLFRAANLKHRRIQCEAAAGLARMGESEAAKQLVELAAEPVARQRALYYADELGLSDQIDDQWRSDYARAESNLAQWLASPDNFGIAPHHLELVDERVLMWPSYTEPRACYLFRFVYPLANGQYSNIGIAGPLVHAFNADMAELPESDIYAAFAGWQAEHPEIYETARSEFNQSHLNIADGFADHLHRNGYSDVHANFLGNFMGESILVGTARHESSEGVVVTDGSEILWYPTTGRVRPVGAYEAYCMYKGRRFLRAFNPEFSVNSDGESDYS